MRTVDTIVTYARSARAFCGWLVHQGLLARSPFSDMTVPNADPPPIRVVDPERFACLLAGCRPLEHRGLSPVAVQRSSGSRSGRRVSTRRVCTWLAFPSEGKCSMQRHGSFGQNRVIG
ncbi:MAG TPA: hypothetical protein VGF67_28660 [Ktedonobacteraceae bacterium]